MIYNNNIGTSKVYYSGFTITRVYACGGELVWSESPFTFKAQYTLNDATSGEVACNGSSTLSIIDFDDYETLTNIRYMTVGECVDTWVVPSGAIYRSLRTLDLSHSNITTLPENFMKGETSLRNVYLNNSTTTISLDAFSGCTSLSAITIPSSVTSIDNEAFRNSGLRDITIHSGITYGGYVYSHCSAATAVTIEQGTLRIEKGTFASCTSLSSVTFPSSITFVGTQAFIGCTGLESLTFTSTTPPNLGEQDSLSSNDCPIYVPCSAMAAYLAAEDWQPYVDRLRPIESQCGSIQYRWQPSGTTCIDFDKYQNNIKQVTYNSGTTWMNVSPAEYSASTLIEHNSEDCGYIEPQYRTITSTTCINTDKWQQDEFQVSTDGGQTWTTTGTSATTLIEANSYDCGYRTRTTSSETYCDGVDKYVDVYDQVSTDAGQSWTTTATTHSLVEENSYDCGYRSRTTSGSPYCTGYDKYVDVYSQVSTDAGQTWTTTATTPTLIEESSEDCGYIANAKYVMTIIGHDPVSAACDSTSAITSGETSNYGGSCNGLTIGNCVKTIGGQAFLYFSYISAVTIPNSVTTIGDSGFEYCTRLTSVTISNSVTSIGEYTFYECSGLTSIDIPSGVTSIGGYAFQSCKSLTSVTIPSGVTEIGSSAFYGCTSLTSVTIEATTPPTLGNRALYNTNNCKILVPSASLEAYKSASGWSSLSSRIEAIP